MKTRNNAPNIKSKKAYTNNELIKRSGTGPSKNQVITNFLNEFPDIFSQLKHKIEILMIKPTLNPDEVLFNANSKPVTNVPSSGMRWRPINSKKIQQDN